ncbi:MAG TPA: type II toxin-antitoxin system HicA family toxin [Chitinophagaceae bacterium]|nr:type II toxin-antitoxin system HicA family toxin [Chitinophagaceae bacterium]
MAQLDKLIIRILSGHSDNNIQFSELTKLLRNFNFSYRIKGSHHIFWKENIDEIINIQPLGNKAKAYQVKQVRDILLKYKMIQDES